MFSALLALLCILFHYCTLILLYFAWEDQKQIQYFICHKYQVCCIENTAQWLTNTVQLCLLVCGKQAHCYSFPCTYMDYYHLIHGFTKLSTTTVNGYCYYYVIIDHHQLCVYCYVAQIRRIQYLTYSILCSWGNKLIYSNI